MSAFVKIEGLKELTASFEEISKAAGRRAVTAALKKAAEPIADGMRERIPEDTGLAKSLIAVGKPTTGAAIVGRAAYSKSMRKTRGDKKQAQRALRMATKEFTVSEGGAASYYMRVGLKSVSKETGKDRRYPHFVEYGTVKMTAQPFVRPTWDAKQVATLDTIVTELKKNLNKATARARAKALKK